MNLNIFKKRKSGLTLVVATTLLFAGPVAAHAATTGADNAADNTGATSASADGNNGIVGTEPGAVYASCHPGTREACSYAGPDPGYPEAGSQADPGAADS